MFKHMMSPSFVLSAAGATMLHIAWVAQMWTPIPLPHQARHEQGPAPMLARTIYLQQNPPTPGAAQPSPTTTADIGPPVEPSEHQLTEQTNPPVAPPTTITPQTDGHYWPGRTLDQKPIPQAPVVIPYPEGFISIAHGHAILQLFINESGLVDRVEVVESEAPIEFTDIARRAFLNTRFTPGVKDRVQVRSKLKIEVGFQNGQGNDGS